MKSLYRPFGGARCVFFVFATLAALGSLRNIAGAEISPIPMAFQDLYTALHTDHDTFNATLNALPQSPSPALFAGDLQER